MRKILKTILIIIGVALFMLALISCKTKRIYIPIKTVVKETEIVRDTIIDIQLEVIRDSVVVSDTISVLENKYASSMAKFTQGNLHHTLKTKDVKVPIEVQYVEKIAIKEVEVPIEVEIIKEVKKPYPFIVRFSIIFTILVLGFSIYKIFK